MIIFKEFLTLYCCYSTNTTQNSLLFVGNLSSNLVLRYNSKLFKTIILWNSIQLRKFIINYWNLIGIIAYFVNRYPLLLNRLYKVTPYHHRDREALRESQQKVELHLEHINQQTKGTIGATTRIWRRISNLSTSHRRLNNADDIGNIKIRKVWVVRPQISELSIE